MRNFFVLLLLALLSTSCSAVKGLRKPKTTKENARSGLIREVRALGKKHLSRTELQRNLHSIFSKYQVEDSAHRKLLFFDLLDLDFEELDIEGLIEILTEVLGGDDEDDDDKDDDEKDDKKIEDSDNIITVVPGSVITTEQTTVYTITAPDGTVTTYTEVTNGESQVVTTGAQFVAREEEENGKKGKGGRMRFL